jgi:serine/threonine protein kinase
MAVLAEKNTIKTLILCDFGTAAIFGNTETLFSKTVTGTMKYKAPEIQPENKVKYDPFKADSKIHKLFFN